MLRFDIHFKDEKGYNWNNLLPRLTVDLKTCIKGRCIYEDICTSKPGEQLEVCMEPDNSLYKFAVCVSKSKEKYHWKISKDNLFPLQWLVLKLLRKSYWKNV